MELPYRFIYRTLRKDFKVVKLTNISVMNIFIQSGYDFILNPTYDLYPNTNLTPVQLREYLLSRGWAYIGSNMPTVFEAADIERICRVGDKKQQGLYFNRLGEFNMIENSAENVPIIKSCENQPGSVIHSDVFYF